MRITMQTIHKNILGNLNRITTNLNTLNQQISSGKQIGKPSDAPIKLANALGLRSNYEELTQFQTNISFGDDVISASENALMEIKDLVSRAKVLALQGINASMTQDNRANMALEIQSIFDQALSLANTQVSGKFIFGGYRTTGYNNIEPTPFMQDLQDGYRINGTTPSAFSTGLTSTLAAGNIVAGDLAVNGNVTTGAIVTAGPTNGLYMDKAVSAQTQIQTADPTVTVSLTTLYAGALATAGTASEVFFYLNNVPVSATMTGASANEIATSTAAAINAVTDLTGVAAMVGDGTNGGVADSVVFYNAMAGDESDINITDFVQVSGTAFVGFGPGDVNQAVGAANNTGQITISSAASFALTSPNNLADDTILTSLGLGGGGIGFSDEAADGALVYGTRLATGDLYVNGTLFTGAVDDGLSDVLADISAAAKAAAFNSQYATNGVRADVTPVSLLAGAPVEAGTESTFLTGRVSANAIAAGDLAINGIAIGAIGAETVVDFGLNMEKAFNTRAAVNLQTANSDVTARLTTLSAGAAATAGTISNVSFDLNGVSISFTTSADPAGDAFSAINAVSSQTGVMAMIGNGSNGGAAGSVVLRNVVSGDESNIVITGYNGGAGTASTGLGNINQAMDVDHNTGAVSFSTTNSAGITLTSPTTFPASDAILAELGLDGGQISTGITGDIIGDGIVAFGSTPEILDVGDLTINGVNIFDVPTLIVDNDQNNALINAINAKEALTGISASRNSTGMLVLSAADGRNLHIQTTALGEKVSHLNGANPVIPQDKVYFGSVILYSDRQFTMETTPTAGGYEPGLAALGLSGGTAVTGEAGDTAGDGMITVKSIINKDGSVRYTGDRDNDLEIRVGSNSNLAVGKNGEDALLNTELFSVLKELQKILEGDSYRQVEAPYQVSDPDVTLASRNTGLITQNYFVDGTFSVTVIDHEYQPVRQTSSTISVDIDNDTFTDVAEKFNGIPGLRAAWDANGKLTIETIDQDRYSLSMKDETGTFLHLMGLSDDQLQVQGLTQSIADLDTLADTLTSQVSDFGSRANRILVQKDIYATLSISTKENLSEMEDTDITEALMNLKAKEIAYEAALSAAAKTMQLSLVDYLR